MFERLWIKFLECFDVVDFANQVRYQGVVENNHVPSKNVNIVEVYRSYLVKYVRNLNVTVSGLYIPASLLRRTQVDKNIYRPHTL